MASQPRGDKRGAVEEGGPSPTWATVLAHRPASQVEETRARFEEHGITPQQVQDALADGGDALYHALTSGPGGWTASFGGPLVASLLAAEVGALTAHLAARAARVRAAAVGQLLDEYSAVTVAAHLGISRQKVYELVRPAPPHPFVMTVPWRRR